MYRRIVAVATLALALAVVASTPLARAAAPNPSHTQVAGGRTDARQTGLTQDPAWLLKKEAFCVHSGVTPTTHKGDKTRPSVSCGSMTSEIPSAAQLETTYTGPIEEPGNGSYPNFGRGTSSSDDAYHYYSDNYFFDLCGPGAADVALYYWPLPQNWINSPNVRDPSNTKYPAQSVTTWNYQDIDGGVYRTRGYLLYLGFEEAAPPYIKGQPGMMEQYSGGGTTLQTMTTALNWEASGENSSDWQNYFYALQWNYGYPGNGYEGTFQADVEADIGNYSVPAVAEVNAERLPNWSNHGGLIRHFVTIVGYDNNAHTYTYLDTCGNTTGCGANTDSEPHTISQSTMWSAVDSVPYNQTTGDGGWVW